MNSSEKWTFFQAFLKSPRVVASVIPSSSFVERRIIAAADLAIASVVVEFGAELERRGYLAADAVISGIPFSTLPETLAAEIVAAVHTALGPGGRFVAYQFTDRVAHYVWPLMGAPEVEYELRNVPPLRVFTWRKESGSGTAANGRSEPGLSIWR